MTSPIHFNLYLPGDHIPDVLPEDSLNYFIDGKYLESPSLERSYIHQKLHILLSGWYGAFTFSFHGPRTTASICQHLKLKWNHSPLQFLDELLDKNLNYIGLTYNEPVCSSSVFSNGIPLLNVQCLYSLIRAMDKQLATLYSQPSFESTPIHVLSYSLMDAWNRQCSNLIMRGELAEHLNIKEKKEPNHALHFYVQFHSNTIQLCIDLNTKSKISIRSTSRIVNMLGTFCVDVEPTHTVILDAAI